VLGKIEFKAPDEASGTDAILVGAAIEAVAEGTFAADNNATELVFKTGASAAADVKMTLTSGGNLLVGKTSANATDVGIVANANGRLYATASGNSSIFNRTSSDGEIVSLRKAGTTVGSIGTEGNDITIDGGVSNHSGLRFSSPAILPRYNGALADGQVDLGQTASNYRFKDLYLSGGAYLGGTGAANKLSDYEEGTWTPSISGATGYSNRNGTYTKIGNFVAVYCYVQLSGNSSGGTNLQVSGLPFLSANNGTYGATSGMHCNSWSTTTKPDNGLISPNYQGIDFYRSSGQTGMAIPLNSDMGTGSLIFSAVYEAA